MLGEPYQYEEPCDGEVDVVRADGLLDEFEIYRAVWEVGQRSWVHATELRNTALFVNVNVGRVSQNHLRSTSLQEQNRVGVKVWRKQGS